MRHRSNLCVVNICVRHKGREAVTLRLCQQCVDLQKKYEENRLNKGFCRSHPTETLVSGRKSCQKCMDRSRAKHERERTHSLKYGVCRQHKTRLAAFQGSTSCQECLDKVSIRSKTWLSNKLCSSCGSSDTEGLTRCRFCRAKNNGRKFGLSGSEYLEKISSMGACEACGNTTKLVLDHDHISGKIRGILCRGCNCALGFLLDSTSKIKGLLEYARTKDIS